MDGAFIDTFKLHFSVPVLTYYAKFWNDGASEK